jgi:hypothetical protein
MLDDSWPRRGSGTERRDPIGGSAQDPTRAAHALDAFGTAGPSVSPSVEQTLNPSRRRPGTADVVRNERGPNASHALPTGPRLVRDEEPGGTRGVNRAFQLPLLGSNQDSPDPESVPPGAAVPVKLPGNGHLPSIGARFPALKCPVLPGETLAETVAVARRGAYSIELHFSSAALEIHLHLIHQSPPYPPAP